MLIVDTGVLVAAADRSDPEHSRCVALLDEEQELLVTSTMVIAETAYLLDREIGPEAERCCISRSSTSSSTWIA